MNKAFVASFFNYDNGVKHGDFKEIRNDSVIVGKYKNDLLDGDIKIYKPLSLWLAGIIPQDIKDSDLITEGHMNSGKKNGNWTYFSLSHSKIMEGQYVNDHKYGEWKYYYSNYVDFEGNLTDYSAKLYLIENYINGRLSGKTERFSSLEKVQRPCDTSIGTVNPLDTCFELTLIKRRELIYYKNGIRHGPFEISDSLGVLTKGTFIFGKKNDIWMFRKENGTILSGGYTDDLENGVWKTILPGNKVINETEYKGGQRDGFSTYYNGNGKRISQAVYNKGQIQTVITFNTNNKQSNQYKNIEYKNGTCTFTHLSYEKDTTFSFDTKIFPLFSDSEKDHSAFLLDAEKAKRFLNGHFSYVNSKGQMLFSGSYINDERSGNWEYFDYKQKIKRISSYSKDELKSDLFETIPDGKTFSGTYEMFATNGKIQARIKVKDGLRNGKTQIFDSNGKVETIKKYIKGVHVK